MFRLLAAISLALVASSCAIVPRYKRGYLANPTMSASDDPLRDRAHSKLHSVREGGAGGDGEPAGGGCGCSN